MISVCIPTYNGGKFIRLQLESILNQLSSDDEVIISDDSSTDDTLDIVRSFKDCRIKIFGGNQFHSPIYNLENALNKAKGDYIFLSDQDDEWCPNKVNKCLNVLKKYNMVIHDAIVVDGNNKQIAPSFFSLNHTRQGKYYNLIKNGYIGCCMAFNRNVLTYSLPFPKHLPMHDLWLGNIAAFKCGHIKFIKDKLILYRRHGNNTSNASEKSTRKIKARIMDRIIIIRNIFSITK